MASLALPHRPFRGRRGSAFAPQRRKRISLLPQVLTLPSTCTDRRRVFPRGNKSVHSRTFLCEFTHVTPNVDPNNNAGGRPVRNWTTGAKAGVLGANQPSGTVYQPDVPPKSTICPRSTPHKDRSSFDEKLAPQHLYHGTEQATTVLREGSRPRVLATTQPRRNRRQQNLKMGEGRRTRRRAPGLCGGGGAATSWPVGISGGALGDPTRRRFRPVCPYGAGRGLPRPADALSTWPMGDAAPLSVGGHALCAGSATGGSPMPSSGRR